MSMFNFAPTANQQPKIELIPAGTPLLCLVTVESFGLSSKTGGKNCKVIFTVSRGPYERRIIRTWISDPNDEKHSDDGRQMSLADMQHMLESCGVFDPGNVESYKRYAAVPPDQVFRAIMTDLDGKYVAIKTKIEKGTNGYEDKNIIQSILSPNPNGRTAKDYEGVKAGSDINVQKPAAAPAATGGFGGFGAPAAAPAATPEVAPAEVAPTAQSSAPAWLGQ